MIGKMDQGNSEDKFNYGMIKLSQYVQQNQIQIEQFWDKHQIFVDVDQFKQFMIAINFPETEKYFKQIVQELQDSKKTITLERLCKRIPYWNNSEEIMIDLIKQKALRIVQSANRQRPQTGNQSLNRPMSGISVVSKYSAYSDLKNLFFYYIQRNVIYDENESKVSIKNNSKIYLKKHDDKQKEIDKMLQITIKKGQYEYEYETHIKMAEINDIVQRVKPNISYRKYKQNDGSMKVHQYDGEYFIRDFTLDEFQREYNIVKQQYDIYKKQQKKEKVEIKKDQKDEFQSQPTNTKQNKQKERLMDLKQVLLETMILTNVMKQQIQVLNKKGINSDPLFIG